jgi:hypothetical protein
MFVIFDLPVKPGDLSSSRDRRRGVFCPGNERHPFEGKVAVGDRSGAGGAPPHVVATGW